VLFVFVNEVTRRKVSYALYAYIYFIFTTIMKGSYDGMSHKLDQYFGYFHGLGLLNNNFRRQDLSFPSEPAKPKQSIKHIFPPNLN
jgi:hypothetical protein